MGILHNEMSCPLRCFLFNIGAQECGMGVCSMGLPPGGRRGQMLQAAKVEGARVTKKSQYAKFIGESECKRAAVYRRVRTQTCAFI